MHIIIFEYRCIVTPLVTSILLHPFEHKLDINLGTVKNLYTTVLNLKSKNTVIYNESNIIQTIIVIKMQIKVDQNHAFWDKLAQ